MLTANPLTGPCDEIQIDAAWGLGESVVATRLRPDHFVVARTGGIRAREIANKSVMIGAAPEGGTQQIAVVAARQDAPSLDDAHVLGLAALGEKIEAHFKEPQDIERARVSDAIFVVQTRRLGRGHIVAWSGGRVA